MLLAKVRYEATQVTYNTHLVARDLAFWYQDYFIFKKETDKAKEAKKAIDDQ